MSKNIVRFFGIAASLAGAVLSGLLIGSLIGLWYNVPVPHDLAVNDLLQTTRIFDARGEFLAAIYIENRDIIPLDDVPIHVQHAFVASEDARFYRHHGFDLKGIIRAALTNIRQGRIVQGGSTITQQVARNFYLNNQKTYMRKLREIVLAIKLESRYSKRDILEAYLNQVYFGAGAYGIAVASRTYFDKESEHLSVAEGAMLAGLIRAPSHYSPWNDRKQALLRQKAVLQRMADTGYIDEAKALAAGRRLPGLAQDSPSLAGNRRAPYFMDYVLNDLLRRYSSQQVYGGGLRVHTTLERHLQMAAEQAFSRVLAGYSDRLQTGIVVIDPLSGRILAMVGGRNYARSRFNRAWQAKRQPGSAFKVFTYTAAIAEGYQTYTLLNDTPVAYDTGGRLWRPRNYSGGFSGRVTLRRALEQSINVPSVDLFMRVGADRVIETAYGMGLETELHAYPSLALGSASLSLLEMAVAYSTIAGNGYRIRPECIAKVYSSTGNLIYRNTFTREAAVEADVCCLMTDIMRGVIERGTGRRAYIGRPAAGKTGTSSDYRDAWFIGFTPGLLTAVWVGRDDNAPMGGIAGGSLPAAIWKGIMRRALAGNRARSFPASNEVIRLTVCRESEEIATAACPRKISDLVLRRFAPTVSCPLHLSGGNGPAIPSQPPVARPSPATPVEKPPVKPSPPPRSPSNPPPATEPETPSLPPGNGTAPPEAPQPPASLYSGNRLSGRIALFVCESTGRLPCSGCPVLVKRSFLTGKEPKAVCRKHERRY